MKEPDAVDIESIAYAIRLIRGLRVLMDGDLAALYGVETKALKRAVRRNSARFPPDFMITLTQAEVRALRRHSGALKQGGHAKYLPYAFTEQGVAMLSSVLQSDRAIQVNIAIMRAFVKLRTALTAHADLAQQLVDLESKFTDHDERIAELFDAMRQLMEPPPESKRIAGFSVKEKCAFYGAPRRKPRA
ncbi:MAG: ORF6N domain-containing protein [Verrucomicrobia bacterium]|nr:ORF6N domain-containing protein [Verrucomicrobiota bacterium]